MTINRMLELWQSADFEIAFLAFAKHYALTSESLNVSCLAR